MRWPRILADRIGIEYPVFQAPMAGGPSTPELTAAVSNAGGLGSMGAGYVSAEALRDAIRATRALTSRPFCMNLFAPEAEAPAPTPDEVARAQAALAPFRAEVGLPPAAAPSAGQPFREQLRVVLEERVPVFSTTFGALAPEDVAALARGGAVVMGTATSVREARALEASGVHAVVAQSGEAGGHRGTFLGAVEGGLAGTLSLVPQIVDAVRIPVVAAGGVMDGRGIAAALALGASAVALGTAFLACPESGASRPYKEAILARRDADETTLTRAFSGRWARGLRNRFTEALASAPALPYPLQNSMTADLRREAAKAGKADLLSLWAGQGVALARARPAGDLVRELVRETEEAVARLAGA
ncbi:MAG TPA: nitronate monooxygenase [Anaeromyxobacter sp.]|nr:nitronate monooxygenase [Anaeromyxobacter sp.]